MSTASLFSVPTSQPTVSFELYPPRSAAGAEKLRRTVAELAAVQPDFFSITYGAAGKTRDTSRELIRQIITDTEVTPIAHLTCVGADRDELREVIDTLLADGVRDFLALRGDPPAGASEWTPDPDGLSRASELVQLLRQVEAERAGDPGVQLSISVATYPGGLRDTAGNPVVSDDDVAALLEKQRAGADFAITQLFFDAGNYAALVSRARDAGVHIPILPGIIPITSASRLKRLEELTQVPVPSQLLAALTSAPDADEAYRRGLAASRRLLTEVLELGAPGLHVYTFNSARPALDLLEGAGLRPSHAV